MAKRRGKAPKGKEEPLNNSASSKVVKKRFKKSSRKIDGTSNSKVVCSTLKHELVTVPTYVSATTSIPPDNDQKKHEGTLENQHIAGFIFMCNKNTKAECYKYRVFGLPKGKFEAVKNISPETKLFLFDTDSKLLYGIYQATSSGALDLEPTAFNGKYQSQVKFKIIKDGLPLPESTFKRAIKDNYDGPRKFKQELSSTQVKSITSLFRPIPKKKTSAQKSHIRPNVASQPSFRPHRDVHHGQYYPLVPGLHVSHSQVQPRLVRVEVPPRQAEVYRPGHAHEAYFPEKSSRFPPDSYQSFRTTIEANHHGDGRFVYRPQYHDSQVMVDRDAYRLEYNPGHYSHQPAATTSLTASLSQARSSAYLSQDRLPSQYHSVPSQYHPENKLISQYHPENKLTSPYRPENKLPSSYSLENKLPSSYSLENRLPSSYHSQDRLPSQYHPENKLTSPYHPENKLPSSYSLENRLSSSYSLENRLTSPYRPENKLPSSYSQENRLPTSYNLENRLPSSYNLENRLLSPHRSYYTAEAASQDEGRFYAGLP